MGLLDHFDIRHLRLNGQTSFGRVHWVNSFGYSFRIPNGRAFLIVRLVFALLAIASVAITILESYQGGQYFFYLTHWTLLANTMFLSLATINTFLIQRKYKRDHVVGTTPVPALSRLVWVLQHISVVAGTIVVILYWVVLYNPTYTGVTITNLLQHGVVFGCVFLDFFINAQPFLYIHVVFMELYALGYLSLALAISLKGIAIDGKFYVYKVLDYRDNLNSALTYSIGIPCVVIPVISATYTLLGCCRRVGYAHSSSKFTGLVATGARQNLISQDSGSLSDQNQPAPQEDSSKFTGFAATENPPPQSQGSLLDEREPSQERWGDNSGEEDSSADGSQDV